MVDMAGKTTLVTGGSGFLGSVVTKLLADAGNHVISFGRDTADLLNFRDTSKLFLDIEPDIVIHLAADCGGIGYNADHPARLLRDNVIMGLNVLDACRYAKVKKVVSIGSVCMYPSRTPTPFCENDLFAGSPDFSNRPYGEAKRLLLEYGHACSREYGMNAIHLIPANLYGPGDTFNDSRSHVIPALIKRFIEARENSDPLVGVWGTGLATREFLHVQDAARAIILATEKYNDPSPVNIGTGHTISIYELTAQIAQFTGYKGKWKFDKARPDGQLCRQLDVSKAKREFGFTASIPLIDGLKQTIEWYEKQRKQIQPTVQSTS